MLLVPFVVKKAQCFARKNAQKKLPYFKKFLKNCDFKNFWVDEKPGFFAFVWITCVLITEKTKAFIMPLPIDSA